MVLSVAPVVAVLLLCHTLGGRAADFPPPREPYTLSWTGAPMVWPSEAARTLYKSAGNFDPSHMVGTRFALFRDQVFLGFPRFRDGTCATLARASLLSPSGEPSWEPFPSWEAQTLGDPKALQNVLDLALAKQVLWALDTGVTDTLTSPTVQCGPRLVGLDPSTGKRLHLVDLQELVTPDSRLQFLAVDADSGNTTLVVSDAGTNSVIVYNLEQDSGYRAVLPDAVSQGCPGAGDILYLAIVKSKLYLTYHCGQAVYSLDMADLRAGTTAGTLEEVAAKPRRLEVVGADSGRGELYLRYDDPPAPHLYAWRVDQGLDGEGVREIHRGEPSLVATHAVFDPLRGKVRVLLSNFLDYLKGSVGVGAVQVLRAAHV